VGLSGTGRYGDLLMKIKEIVIKTCPQTRSGKNEDSKAGDGD
jgi:hypothetical protein